MRKTHAVIRSTSTWILSSVLGAAFFSISALASEQLCQPELHGDIGIHSGDLLIRDRQNLFRIDTKGNLFFDVHKVALSDEQRASLTAYNHTIRNDVSFIRQSLHRELQQSWQALDDVLINELGNASRLRNELGRFHQHLQTRLTASFKGADSQPFFNHQVLTDTVQEIQSGVPIFIAMIASEGLQDFASMSGDQQNKMQFISDKMANLQSRLVDEIDTQRRRSEDLQQEVCNRFTHWQHQETLIAELIPALSQWKTVTVR